MLSRVFLCLIAGLVLANGSVLEHQRPIAVTDVDNDIDADAAPSYRADLLALHKALVEIPSVTGNEAAVAEYLVDYFTYHDWSAKLEAVPGKSDKTGADRFNVLAWPPSEKDSKPKVLVTSHIDVVPPHIPYSISDEKPTRATVIKGRGSVDAKGSVAAQITAVEELLSSEDIEPEELMLLFVVDEEKGGAGMRYFSDTLQRLDPPRSFEAVIFGEPTELKLACGHKGGLVCFAEAHGKAGHSGYPWLGKSATELLMRGLVRILDTDLGSSEDWGNSTINVGLIEGGVAGNVIPERATATLMGRIALTAEQGGHEAIVKKMEEVIKSVDDEDLILDCPAGSPVVKCDCDVGGFETIVANYGTDIPNLKGNHTRYLYGPGTILVAHSDHEALTVGDLEDAVEGFKKLITHALKG